MGTNPAKEGYFEDTFLPDVFIGCLSLAIVLPLALVLGGFSFIEPWCIVTPPTTFALGMVRGESAGNIWLKGIGMNVVFLLLQVFVADTRTFALGALVIVLPTVAGIWLRRRRSRTKISPNIQ
jgi:hypothetical protein